MARAAAAAPRWPLVAAVLYACLVPIQPVFDLPDGSQLRFAAADLVAPFVLLAGVALPRRRLPSLALVLSALPLLALFTTMVAAIYRMPSSYAIGKTAGLFYLVGVCLALARALPAGGAASLLRGLEAGAFWSAVVGLAGFAAWMQGVRTSLVDVDRLCSTMTGDPNIYCSLLAVGILIAATDERRSGAWRAGRVAVLGLAVLATGSRSGTLGLAAGAAVAVVLQGRDRWVSAARGAYVAAVVVAAAAVVVVTDVAGSAGQALFGHLWRTRTVDSRFALYQEALAEFAQHPLLGLGIGGFRDLNTWTSEGLKFHSAVHNTYLWGIVDLGIGGLLVTAVVMGALYRAVRACRVPAAAALARPVAAGLAAMAIFNLFVDGFYQRHFWVLVAGALMLPAVRHAEHRGRAAGPEGVRRAA
jgi:O-antigen ligase